MKVSKFSIIPKIKELGNEINSFNINKNQNVYKPTNLSLKKRCIHKDGILMQQGICLTHKLLALNNLISVVHSES